MALLASPRSLCRWLRLSGCSRRQLTTTAATLSDTFKYSDLEIERTSSPSEKPPNDKLVFGTQFSDHMLSVRYVRGSGWQAPRIHPVKHLQLHPGAKVLHYALECFEGMKAYWGVDEKIRMFRPLENMRRLRSSCERATLATFEPEEMLKCVRELIRVDSGWVPRSQECSLYIRPTAICTEPRISVHPADETLLYVITSPVGPYYASGFKPVTLLADNRHVRAWPGGTGSSKMGSNYGPTCYVQQLATKYNCQQVLWLFGEDEQLTEVGTMNLFVLRERNGRPELLTPPLDSGLILPGITRDSLLRLAREWKEFDVVEAPITMREVKEALSDGSLKEMFGCGTACVVSPISEIRRPNGETLAIPTMSQGAPVTMRFLKTIVDIQYGRLPDHPWADVVV